MALWNPFPKFKGLQHDLMLEKQVAGAHTEMRGVLPIVQSQSPLEPQPQDQPVPELLARAVLVRDHNSGDVLYEKNPDERVPIASLTKLMTAILVAKHLSLAEPVEIAAPDLRVPEDRAGLVGGEVITVQDLLKAMLISSANDASMALARHSGGTDGAVAFVEAMNRQARALNMKDTSFANPVGFDHEDHFSTARDLALLVEEFFHYPELLEIVKQKEATIKSLDGKYAHTLLTTNRLMLVHPEILGLKTGFTTEAKGNLIIFVQDGSLASRPVQYYSIILGSPDREAETEKIFRWVRKNFIWQ